MTSRIRFKKHGLSVIAAASIMLTIFLGITISRDVSQLNNLWHDYVEKESIKSGALARTIISFGYGGFIHNYKNFILRKDKKYEEATQISLDKTYEAIDTYLSLETKPENKKNIGAFKTVVDEYNEKFKLITRLIKEGKSSNEIDKTVYVDDKLAIKSLELLLSSLRNSSTTIIDDSLKKINNLQKTILVSFIFIVSSLIISTIFITMSFRNVLAAYKEISILLSSVPNAIIVTDKEGRIKRVNKKAIEVFGYSRREFLTLSIESLIPIRYRTAHIDDRIRFQKSSRTIAMESRTTAFIALRKNGDEFPVKISVSTFHSGKENKNIAVIQDMSIERQLEEDASKDHLTKVANRKKSFEFLANAINQAKRYKHPLSVIMCDIDNFKIINDTFGHGVGDDVLIKVSTILQKNIRDTDLLARWGGEEFLIICPETTKENAYIVAENLRSKVKLTFQNTKTPLTMSLGVTEFNIDEDIEDIFIERADIALYDSKNNGRNKTSIH